MQPTARAVIAALRLMPDVSQTERSDASTGCL